MNDADLQDLAASLERGDRVRVTVESEVVRTTEASGNRGVASVLLRAGAGMNDCVWLVREPESGRVVDLARADAPPPDADLFRVGVRAGGTVDHGDVACDPSDVLHDPDVWDEGTLMATLRLPVDRMENLADALELLDEMAETMRSSETLPWGWKAVRDAIAEVMHRLEVAGLIPGEQL